MEMHLQKKEKILPVMLAMRLQMSNGLEEDTITRNVMDGQMDQQTGS